MCIPGYSTYLFAKRNKNEDNIVIIKQSRFMTMVFITVVTNIIMLYFDH